MLCAVFTFCAEALGLAGKLYFSYRPVADEPSGLVLLPYVTLVIGLVSGVLCLLLTPLVYRLRKTPPPQLITLGAVLIGLAPLATLAVRWLRS
jgi:hypothetical protein